MPQQPNQKVHITLTGPYAGYVLCAAPRNDDDKYVHAPYAPLDTWAFKDDLCKECKKLWLED